MRSNAASWARSLAVGAIAFGLAVGCTGRRSGGAPVGERAVAKNAPSARPSASAAVPARELTWSFEPPGLGRMQAVVLVPPRRGDERFPVLVTMHGKGEAAKGVARGARGWIDDYWLPKAMQRLSQPPLSAEDLLGFADAARLERVNAELRRVPYGGMIVVCPYTPDILAGDRAFAAAEPFAHFVVDELLPRVRRELPASPEPAQTGIDGVSLGGRAALLLGLTRPEAFGAVGTLQAAFDRADAAPLASLAARAQQAHPRLAIRLLTSDADYFLPAHRAISAAFATRGVRHALTVVPGPHDYAFNRGPGAFEMLLFHDRALRGQPWLD